jgi:hypothetical protein
MLGTISSTVHLERLRGGFPQTTVPVGNYTTLQSLLHSILYQRFCCSIGCICATSNAHADIQATPDSRAARC